MASFPTTCILLLKQRKLKVDYIRDSEPRTSLCRGWRSSQGLKTTMHKYSGLFIPKKNRSTEYISIDYLPWRFFFQSLIPWWSALYLLAVNSGCPCIDLGHVLSQWEKTSVNFLTHIITGTVPKILYSCGPLLGPATGFRGKLSLLCFLRLSAQFWKVSVQRRGKMKQQSSQLQLPGPLNYL